MTREYLDKNEVAFLVGLFSHAHTLLLSLGFAPEAKLIAAWSAATKAQPVGQGDDHLSHVQWGSDNG
ncbi:MAG TPA: hypothetical protein VMH26_21680 [Burkholderiales bacterium]|nr:hypothetical protein [Burkholderiales bacterium]